MIRVIIADDQALVRTGFHLILDLEPDMEVVGEAADGVQCVDLVRRYDPDVVLMDVRMPVLDGIEATRILSREQRRARVIVLTTFDLDEYVYAALRAGAARFLLKDAPREQLVSAIRQCVDGDVLLAPAITHRLIERFVKQRPASSAGARFDALSTREREVLALIVKGKSNAEIAHELFLGEATVKTHIARMLAKVGARDRIGAIILAYETGYVTPGS